MAETADFLIVGGGVIGASIAYHLARQGRSRVILCEQNRPALHGSTKMSGGLIRMHHTNPYQAKLAWDSYQTYNNWSEIIGGDCEFVKTGFFQVVEQHFEENLKKNVVMLKNIGIPTTIVSADEFVSLQPLCSKENVGLAAYEPESGYANPLKVTNGFLQRAIQQGLCLYEGVQVDSLIERDHRIQGVYTNIGEIYAKETILAGNIWVNYLLKKHKIDLPIRSKRIGICFLELPTSDLGGLSTYIDDTIGTYFRPVSENQVLLGLSTDEMDLHPDQLPPLGELEIRIAQENLAKRIPLARKAKVHGGRSSFDSYTPDKHSILGRVDGISGLYLATGFSGGGFKVAPAVGQAVSTEVFWDVEVDDLNPFRLSRFVKNQHIRPHFPYTNM